MITELTLSDAERAHVSGDSVRSAADEDSVFNMSNDLEFMRSIKEEVSMKVDKKGLQKLYAILERVEGKIDVLMSGRIYYYVF